MFLLIGLKRIFIYKRKFQLCSRLRTGNRLGHINGSTCLQRLMRGSKRSRQYSNVNTDCSIIERQYQIWTIYRFILAQTILDKKFENELLRAEDSVAHYIPHLVQSKAYQYRTYQSATGQTDKHPNQQHGRIWVRSLPFNSDYRKINSSVYQYAWVSSWLFEQFLSKKCMIPLFLWVALLALSITFALAKRLEIVDFILENTRELALI